MKLAPIVIFTFNRFEHTKKMIKALQNNILSDESEVFIFSDGPRNDNEALKVENVRRFIKSVNGFKKVTIFESKINKGLANSVIDGVTEIINKYGKIIVLEDDLVTSKYFLKYMNEALETYESRKDIWSISGYSPNINIPSSYKDEVYLIRRGGSWGWATWKNRWILNDWDIGDYTEFKKNRKRKKEFNIAGTDMSPMLEDQMKKRINSWAIRWGYNQYKLDMWTVFPIKSFVKNIGADMSGTHTPITNKYDVELFNEMIKLNGNIIANNEICKNYKKLYDLNFIGYISIFVKRVGLYKQARKSRNAILCRIRRKNEGDL